MRFRARHLFVVAVLLPIAAGAQSLDLTINHYGLSIGDSRFVRGVRLNFRDRNLERVEGVNVTIWSPYEPMRGVVKGLALGLPVTGARAIHGAGIGILGVGVAENLRGIGLGGLGIGAGGDVQGIMVGGLGVGGGGNVTGLMIGGLGVGTGGNVRGITFGGLGAGAGGDVTGLQVGVLGVGAGGRVEGITIAGLGAGAGGDVTGLTVSVVGAGSGGDITGITLAGIGVGAGGTVRGLAFGGIGVGAPRIRGIALSAVAAGGEDVKGGVLAPFYFTVSDDGRVSGLTMSAWNRVRGDQYGISLGLLNTAWDLHGWQIGVLNYAANNPKGLRLLPLFNREW